MKIKKFVDQGILVQPDVLDQLNTLGENDFDNLISSMKAKKVFMVSKKFLEEYLSNPGLKIIKSFKGRSKETISDYVRQLNKKYKTLQEILMKKSDIKNLVSVNKCNNGKVNIIGLVKDVKENTTTLTIEIEDTTGSIKCSAPKKFKENISLDDVIAVEGSVNNKILFVENIIWPDIPIKDVKYSKETIRLSYRGTGDYVIYDNYIIDKNGKKNMIQPPCFVEIGGVSILIVFDVEPLDVLKKRYVKVGKENFLIKFAPDVFVTNKDISLNYKGVTIIGCNKEVNLKNRDVI